MPEKQKEKEQATSDTVKTQLASMSLANAALTAENTRLTNENDSLKRQCGELAGVIENDLKADLILRIQAASKGKYQPDELQSLDVDKLKNIEEVMVKSGAFETATYKTIRAGNAGFDHSARLTVGDLYKSHQKGGS